MPVTIVGLPNLIRKLDPAMLLGTSVQDTVKEAGEEVQKAVKERTPVVTHALQDSIELQTWPSLAKVSTDSPYGPFIETGVRNDRRVRGGKVYRRAGAARMFRLGAQDARDIVKGKMKNLAAQIAARWG